MRIRERIQEEMKQALKNRDQTRLESLRMIKGTILLKEKESSNEVSEEALCAALRAEVRKRRDSIEIFRQHGKPGEAEAIEAEILVFEEFLPKQLTADEIEARIKAYLQEHPETNHAGKLTGAMKKELGDLADGKILNDLCKKALGVD